MSHPADQKALSAGQRDLLRKWRRSAARRRAECARQGDWMPLLEQLRSSPALSREERKVLLELFAGTLEITKIKIDKRRIPRPPSKEREASLIGAVNFVIWKLDQGVNMAEAVKDASVEYEIDREATIYEAFEAMIGQYHKLMKELNSGPN